MSQRQNKTGVPHLVFQAKTGFQYYLTFPKHSRSIRSYPHRSVGLWGMTKPWLAT